MSRIVQLTNGTLRRVALVDEPHLHLLRDTSSTHALASTALDTGRALAELVLERATDEALLYDDVYEGRSSWKLLPPIDHPVEPARCLVSGTGLTHLGSAKDRDAMHDLQNSEAASDSIRMFRGGLAGGKPAIGTVGVAPEWFYKSSGAMLRAHGEPLVVPGFAEDGGEEAEVAGCYIVDRDGTPWRVGLVTGNEFSDHVFERRNYLNLAGSKLRTAAIGPELVLEAPFDSIPGEVRIERGGQAIWSRAIATGESEMSHSLRNIEHHHFKFNAHRRPGDVHVHFFGAHSLSFGAGIALADGDVMSVQFDGFGRALRNVVRVEARDDRPIVVREMS
jgi:hypothetical protein